MKVESERLALLSQNRRWISGYHRGKDSAMSTHLTDLENQIADELCPSTALERWFANEIAYASWELSRVRANTANTDAEACLNAAYSRAARNWSRARKELKTIQSARNNHFVLLEKSLRPSAQFFPLSDPRRAPLPKDRINMEGF